MKLPANARAKPASNNEEMITWAYRLFLDREPESQQSVKAFASLEKTGEVRRVFQDSAEYRDRNALFTRDVRSKERQIIESQAASTESQVICDFIASVWKELGREMPHWSVLSSDQFRPDKITLYESDFFESGATDVDVLLAAFARTGINPTDIGHAVEFGCGLGRVTKFLAQTFAHVSAIDISDSHLGLAKQYIGRSKARNVAFILAQFPNFGLPAVYDLWLSRLVLQHNPPPIMRIILTRALAGLQPGGIAVFQVPTYAVGYRFSVRDYVASLGKRTREIEMHCLPMQDVFEIVSETQCLALEVMADSSVSEPGWVSTQFVVRKC